MSNTAAMATTTAAPRVGRLKTAATITAKQVVVTEIQLLAPTTTNAIKASRKPADVCTTGRTGRNAGSAPASQTISGMDSAIQSRSCVVVLSARKTAGGRKMTPPAATSATRPAVCTTLARDGRSVTPSCTGQGCHRGEDRVRYGSRPSIRATRLSCTLVRAAIPAWVYLSRTRSR